MTVTFSETRSTPLRSRVCGCFVSGVAGGLGSCAAGAAAGGLASCAGATDGLAPGVVGMGGMPGGVASCADDPAKQTPASNAPATIVLTRRRLDMGSDFSERAGAWALSR